MSEDDRKEFAELLKNSTLFPEYGKKILMAAFFNKDMSDGEARDLLNLLTEEKQKMDEIDQKEKTAIEEINKKYGIT